MSGPKVVNIEAVRRRLQRESARRLRELNAAIEECLAAQQADSNAANELRKQNEGLLAQFNQMRDAGRWQELVNQITSYRDFYQEEAIGLRQRVVERRAAALKREHRLRQSAAQLSAQLIALPASAERDAMLCKLAAPPYSSAESAGVIADAAEYVSRSNRDAANAVHNARIGEEAAAYANLAPDAPESSLPDAPKDPDEVRLDRCWSLLGELEAIEDRESIATWKAKAQFIAEAEPGERTLLLDSMALELTSRIRTQRSNVAARNALEDVLSDLDNISSPAAEEWRKKIRTALTNSVPGDQLQTLIETARSWIAEEYAREDANEQRAAVLRALSTLGYEIREGMAAAWTEQGRVVVHKPSESLYGIEFSAPPAGGAFQTRVVSEGAQQRSAQRDREVEETWCTEFSRLQELLAENGFRTNLVKAHAPGVVPIKTLSEGKTRVVRGGVPLRKQLGSE